MIAFFICWAPFHVQRLVATYTPRPTTEAEIIKYRKVYNIVTYISGILYYVSTTINPLLYNIMSNKFREAFKVSNTCNSCVRVRFFVLIFKTRTNKLLVSRCYQGSMNTMLNPRGMCLCTSGADY